MRFAALLVIGGLAGLAPLASAQAASLRCKGDEALVRISDLPVPADVAEKWKDAPAAEGDRCTLSSGQKVLVRYRERQGFAWGTMGGSPEWQLSLWVDGRKLVSRAGFRPEEIGSASPRLNRVLYAPGALELCRYPNDNHELKDISGLVCEKKRIDLAAISRDPLEPSDESRIGRIDVAGPNEAFCRSFIRRTGDRKDLQPHGNEIRMGLMRDPRESLVFGVAGHDLPFDDRAKVLLERGYDMRFSLARFDFLNTGAPQTVVEITGMSRDFFGSAYLVSYTNKSDAEAKAFVEKTTSKWMLPDELAQLGAKEGWVLAPAPFDPHMRHEVVRVSGVTFVLASPFYREDNATAFLYRGGQRVCTFQLVEPNFWAGGGNGVLKSNASGVGPSRAIRSSLALPSASVGVAPAGSHHRAR